jgi:hypothetical protein
MPHRKLIQIGTPQKLPTIREFLTEMAERQRDEIRRLKAEVLHGETPEQSEKPQSATKLVPDPWQLHPVRFIKTRPQKKNRAKVRKRK